MSSSIDEVNLIGYEYFCEALSSVKEMCKDV